MGTAARAWSRAITASISEVKNEWIYTSIPHTALLRVQGKLYCYSIVYALFTPNFRLRPLCTSFELVEDFCYLYGRYDTGGNFQLISQFTVIDNNSMADATPREVGAKTQALKLRLQDCNEIDVRKVDNVLLSSCNNMAAVRNFLPLLV
jgi:hypothetical protein